MLGKMKLGLDSNGFSFPLKVNPTLREATGSQGRTRTSHKAQRRTGQIALVMSQEDSLQGSAYRAGGSSGQGPSNAEKALPSPVIGSVGKRDTVNLRQEQVVFPLSFPMLPTLKSQIQTTSGEGDAQGWKAVPLMLSRKSGGSSILPCKGEGSHVSAHFSSIPHPWAGHLSLHKSPLVSIWPYSVRCLTGSGVTCP